MKQLVLGDIMKLATTLLEEGMAFDKVKNLPIYLGNDDELNGVHYGWYCEIIEDDLEENKDIIEMIKDEDLDFKGKGILIS